MLRFHKETTNETGWKEAAAVAFTAKGSMLLLLRSSLPLVMKALFPCLLCFRGKGKITEREKERDREYDDK